MEVRSSALYGTAHKMFSFNGHDNVLPTFTLSNKGDKGHPQVSLRPGPSHFPSCAPAAPSPRGQRHSRSATDPTNTSSAPTPALPGVSAGTNVCLWAWPRPQCPPHCQKQLLHPIFRFYISLYESQEAVMSNWNHFGKLIKGA